MPARTGHETETPAEPSVIPFARKLDALKTYLREEPCVEMAFLFGSRVTGRDMRESDVDIGVYFTRREDRIEWEEAAEPAACEHRVWGRMESILGLDTDMVVLNRAPADLAMEILERGEPLVVKDRSLLLRFQAQVRLAGSRFAEFVEDYVAIKQRSRSLDPVDRKRLLLIVDFLEDELRDHDALAALSENEYRTSSAQRRNVERWVENLVNGAIDVAKILLASEARPVPRTYREALESLGVIEGFDPSVAETLGRHAKLRNILAHEYLDVRFRSIRRFLQDAGPAFTYLLGFARSFADRPGGLAKP